MLTENGKRKKIDLVLLGLKAQRLKKRVGKRGGRKQSLIYKRKRASTLIICCVSLPQSPSIQQSPIIFEQELLREQKEHGIDRAACLFGPEAAG